MAFCGDDKSPHELNIRRTLVTKDVDPIHYEALIAFPVAFTEYVNSFAEARTKIEKTKVDFNYHRAFGLRDHCTSDL